MDAPQRKFRWLPVALLMTPVFYILSVGPACWLTARFDLKPDIVNVIYCPLLWGHRQLPQAAKRLSERYVNLGLDDRTQIEIENQQFDFWDQVATIPATRTTLSIDCSLTSDGAEPLSEDVPAAVDDKLAGDATE